MPNQKKLNYALPGLMIAGFMIGFYPIAQKLMIRWDSGDNSYCYLIVPLFLYLCWEKKSEFHFGQFSWNLWGLVPILLSLVLMVAGELGQGRFVVLGDDAVFQNRYLDESNRKLAIQLLDWLSFR